MGNCAKQSNYLLKEIVHVVEVASTVQSKAMMDMLLLATESGAAHQKSRSAKRRAHNSSSTSIDCARL